MQNPILEKAKDDEDFLNHYGSYRSKVVTQAYRDGYDRIFSADRTNASVDVRSNESRNNGDL